jgi:hypothetical protein
MQDNPGMHFVIAHASPAGPQCQEAIAKLQLPHLARLLKRLTPTAHATGSAQQLTPLYERIQAQTLGLLPASLAPKAAAMDATDGLVPWAAQQASTLHLVAPSTAAWAWITPCQWRVNADHVAMLDPNDLALTADESTTLQQAMQGYFAEDGIALQPVSTAAPGTWLASGAVFKQLPTASLERARGARVDRWMPRQPQAQALRRLQNEMQMLLYTHPINDARAAKGLPTINSFWISGTGDLPADFRTAPAQGECTVRHDLRTAALEDHAAGWLAAWQALDTTVLAPLCDQPDIELTLCGENQAHTFRQGKGPWWRKLHRQFTAPAPAQLLTQFIAPP